MAAVIRSLGSLDTFLEDVELPETLFALPDLHTLLAKVGVLDFEVRDEPGAWSAEVLMAFEGSLSIPLLGQGGARLIIGEDRQGWTFLTTRAERQGSGPLLITAEGLRLAVRLDASTLSLDESDDARPPGLVFEGDVEIGSDLSLTASDVHITANVPGFLAPGTELLLRGFHVGRDCLALTWVSYDEDTLVRRAASLRAIWGNPLQEVRLDLELDGPERLLSLPGLKVQLPADPMISLVLGAGGQGLGRAAICLTLPEGTELVLSSDFAWERGNDREIHGDQDRPADAPLLRLAITAKEGVTLDLIDWAWKESQLPRFLRQLEVPIEPLGYTAIGEICTPTPFAITSMKEESWDFDFTLNLERAPFEFPFLKQQEGENSQFLRVVPDLRSITLDIPHHSILVPMTVTLTIGPLALETQCDLGFNWETFAFRIDHDEGLKLYSPNETLEPAGEHLGLRWRFRGAPVGDGRFHYFTLVTKDNNYQVLQAPGATFEIEYTQLSDEGIGFAISDFALGASGISLTATVIDRPAKLNGIDTRFRFSGSQLVIKENQITDFTLMGSGPLPPALVGDATADIALQMAQRDGKLTLVSGAAKLKGSKLLDCKGTRFQFSVDAIGVKFVYEGKFHLYFTLTGSAQFTPQRGDDGDGALALLGKVRIDLLDCPLTGDASVIAKHIQFLVELPKPLKFNFLGAFEMELRGIGFIPQAEVFDNDGAMLLTGQLKFAQGAGDTPDPRTDLHKLLIGLPKKGSIIPRIHFEDLPVSLNLGSAFRLNGTVDFVDGALEKGFTGEGVMEIQGLPTFAAAFAFLRVRRDDASPWVRAWFIYLEVRKVSFQIPVVTLYIREVGLGFGYRYTLASIRAADQEGDVRKLLQELKVLSRTQGELSKRDRWSIDLEDEGQDPRWTVALRAMISQTSAQTSPLRYDEKAEKVLACVFLLDVVIALRSDFTFFMAARGWLFANYYDFVTDFKGLRNKPVLSGFVLLSPRRKMLLANVSSNPGGQFGNHPPMPDIVQKALESSQFTATLLVEPGLFHTELGWPNQLRWDEKIGPLQAEFRGGFIFRVSSNELVQGISFLARSRLEISAELSLGIVGVRVSALASVAFGGRYIGLLDLRNPLGGSALYAGIGLEVMIRFSIEFWIRIKLGFIKITKTFRFSFSLDFTAGLEVGIAGGVGLRGSGHLAVSVMGRRFALSVRFGLNEGVVQKALDRTQHVLQQGLEATDVEPIPGVAGGGQLAARAAALRFAVGSAEALVPAAPRVAPAPLLEEVLTFHPPGYTLFVIRGATAADWSHFVLMPAGERASGSGFIEEPGFLPAPPPDGVTPQADFLLQLTKSAAETYTLEQFDPATRAWTSRVAAGAAGTISFNWKADWEAAIAVGQRHPLGPDGQPTGGEPVDHPFSVRQYLRNAFVVRETDDPAGGEPLVELLGDPTPLPDSQHVEDERVRNPTDAAFEAAVRGALEQFRGSPFFRRDPNSEYEQLLQRAYRDDTTIYDASGAVPEDAAALERMQRHQQAHELRGLVVHDMISDVRDYVAAADKSLPALTQSSIAFAMRLVFRVQGTPAWLDDLVAGGPTLAQRLGPQATAPSAADAQAVRTFNVRSATFATNPPRFEGMQQLTDAGTIAFAWDLTWPQAPSASATPSQADPEHHLLHYHVRRRALDGNDREVVYTVKGADTLHREEGGVLKRLRRRFQIVDHFSEETAEDLAALPTTGKSYFYSITPVDVAGNAGRPLSIVATRYPNDPPAVPVDAECTVEYALDQQVLLPDSASAPAAPVLVVPQGLLVEWTDPPAPQRGPNVPVETYRLVFRRESVLPIGSYGLDSSTQRPAAKSLPTSNARALPTDVKVPLEINGTADARWAEVDVPTLQAAGVLPVGTAPAWRPEAWRVFFQTVSQNGVPSALAPVQLMLRAEALVSAAASTASGSSSSSFSASTSIPDPVGWPGRGKAKGWQKRPRRQDPPSLAGLTQATLVLSGRREERRPAELEWLPRPMRFSLLPAEDQQGQVGPAHVPMPRLDPGQGLVSLRFTPDLSNIEHARHPAGLRCVRIRWNQGPSGAGAYPLSLNAGYTILELDVDAHTTETFGAPDLLAAAMRPIQEVQMIPAGELSLVPADTLAPTQWEAWYPSHIQRRCDAAQRALGSEIPASPWYSWRESCLRWPAWANLTGDDGGRRDSALHPALQRVIDLLQAPDESTGLASHRVELQTSPAMQPGDLAAFLKSTAPSSDPYGWGVLQRFGLSTAFRLRTLDQGVILTGSDLLGALNAVLQAAAADLKPFETHLHVELLFQPGRAVELAPAGASLDALVALVQLSLRPVVVQRRRYGRIPLEGRPGDSIELMINLDAGKACSVNDQGDRASGQQELSADPEAPLAVKRAVRFPIGGRTALLVRGFEVPRVGVPLNEAVADPAGFDAAFQGFLQYAGSPAPQVIVVQPFTDPAAQRAPLVAWLGAANVALADRILAVRMELFEATDELASYFTVDPATLAADFTTDPEMASGWKAFRRYAESLSSTDEAVPPEDRIAVPLDKAAIEALIPSYASWSQRFFDSGGAVEAEPPQLPELAPWVTTAYPRAGSPVQAAPDASGRLKYDHLISDPWAHDYRYYVRPRGRYDLLWQGLRQSPVLFPGTPKLEDPLPDPNAGGLDVVLERTRPVAKPLVLASGRLDAPSTPASPAPPGTTWEVIVAEHPEQALVEHNQTLVRQLAFRQVSYTVLRTFAKPAWVTQLGALTTPPQPIELDLVEDHYPAPPAAYPAAPEHLDLAAPLSAADARALDLPARLGAFQQGAIALQWEGLPFYYEHRLLLVAQSASTVSPINEIVQRDFEYRTPDPQAAMEAALGSWTPQPPFGSGYDAAFSVRSRKLHVPLCQLWESVPEVTQERWPSEAPDGIRRKPAWFPDLGVVYQLVEFFQGNVEVQADVYFDEGASRFARRQIGSRFLVDLGELTAPADAAGKFSLALVAQQITQQELSREYGDADRQRLPEPTRSKVSVSGRLMSFVGVMSHADRDALLAALDEADAAVIRRLHDTWDAEEPISAPPAAIPPALVEVLDLVEPDEVRLVWEGPMSAAERSALLALPGDAELTAGLQQLADTVAARSGGAVSVPVVTGPDQVPATLAGRVALPSDGATGRYTELRWSGNLEDADGDALRAWARVRALADAVAALTGAADERRYEVPVTAARPLDEELPAILAGRLHIRPDQLVWSGPAPTDGQRAALLALDGDEAFLDARSRLLAAIDADRSVPLGPVVPRPSNNNLPNELAGQLDIASTQLTWTAPPPTDAQRAALLALVGDRAFVAAIRALIVAVDAGDSSVPMAAFVVRPAQDDLPERIRAQLLIETSALAWTGPAPDTTLQAALDAIAADDAMMDALAALRLLLDADQVVPMAPVPRRPRQAELPEWLAVQLEISPRAVAWTGRLRTSAWRAALQQLGGDPPFVAALAQLVQSVDSQTIGVPFTVPVRPSQGALGALLADKLLLGRSVLRYHGIMTRAEVAQIQALFTGTADRRAVVRLYGSTQASGMNGRELRIRARRGTAPPSALVPITTISL